MNQSVVEVGRDSALEERVTRIIADAGLVRPQNRFFARAQSIEDVNPVAALRVAVAWQAMTRAFMFTTIAGLGTLAAQLATGGEPSRDVLGAVQTAYKVIGDDMANFAPEFSAVSPTGADGIHYVWWADTIVAPLLSEVGSHAAPSADELPQGVATLISNMQRLASAPLGAAVQLRVVEAIALDIAVAFRRTYSKVTMGGRRPFREDGALDWVDSHIRAETSHAASVSDDETGMTMMAGAPEEQEELLRLAEEYTASWAMALDDFAAALTIGERVSASEH